MRSRVVQRQQDEKGDCGGGVKPQPFRHPEDVDQGDSQPRQQAQEMRTTIESLTSVSNAVVVAKAIKTESFWNDDRTAILTRVTLQVSDHLRGETPGQTEIIIPGGQIGTYIHEVSDMPTFQQDEEAIVFVERHTSGVNVVAGGLLGKLPIEEDRKTGIKSVSGSGLILMKDDLSAVEVSSDEKESRVELQVFKQRFRERIK